MRQPALRPGGDGHETNQAPTVEDLANRHISDHAGIKNKARSVDRARRAWDRCVLPALGKRKVKDITRADVAKLMTTMAETPAMANKVLTLLSIGSTLAATLTDRPGESRGARRE